MNPSQEMQLELVVEQGGRPVLTRAVAFGDSLTIGRGPECSVQLDEPSSSREHARIGNGAAAREVRDVSTNGTIAVTYPARSAASRSTATSR